jgi:hypothetical protein
VRRFTHLLTLHRSNHPRRSAHPRLIFQRLPRTTSPG